MKKSLLSMKMIPFFSITGMSFDELLDEAIEMTRREKIEQARKTQEEFLKKKERKRRKR